MAYALALFGAAVLLLKVAAATQSYALLGSGLLLALAGVAISLRDHSVSAT